MKREKLSSGFYRAIEGEIRRFLIDYSLQERLAEIYGFAYSGWGEGRGVGGGVLLHMFELVKFDSHCGDAGINEMLRRLRGVKTIYARTL